MGIIEVSKWFEMKVEMPDYLVGPYPYANTAGWWAVYFLELGRKGEGDLLIHLPSVSQRCDALPAIRLAAEQVMLMRRHVTKELKRMDRMDKKERKRPSQLRLKLAA